MHHENFSFLDWTSPKWYAYLYFWIFPSLNVIFATLGKNNVPLRINTFVKIFTENFSFLNETVEAQWAGKIWDSATGSPTVLLSCQWQMLLKRFSAKIWIQSLLLLTSTMISSDIVPKCIHLMLKWMARRLKNWNHRQITFDSKLCFISGPNLFLASVETQNC